MSGSQLGIKIVDEVNKADVGLGLKTDDNGPVDESEFPDVNMNMDGFFDYMNEKLQSE